MIRSSVLLLLCVSALYANAAPPNCVSNGAYADADNCAGFYECAGGVATERQCPFGMFFNSGTACSASNWTETEGKRSD